MYKLKNVALLNPLNLLVIGYVNKLGSNFGKLQSKVLINLFKSYCCSFYGSHLWKFNSTGFDKCCKAWNIAIRTLLGLPYNAHGYLLGPLVRQINIREQFYVLNYLLTHFVQEMTLFLLA